jgi:hypothetical protein
MNFCLFAATACAVESDPREGAVRIHRRRDAAGNYALREESSGIVFITSQELRKTIGVL